ncbi:MAG: hypothetical protein JO014_15200 [Metakosakonia sp.]|nr:hypothetical protein [Phytobacter sp.]MBV8874056.1 hypothetical protein [Phytobacter sp.]
MSNMNHSMQSEKTNLEENRLKRIRKRNIRAVTDIKIPLACTIVIVSCLVIFHYVYLFQIEIAAVFWFLVLPMIVGLAISSSGIPKMIDFLKPLIDTIIYVPASILAVFYILNSVTNISEQLKNEAVHHWYVYVTLSIIAGSTIIKCSIAFSESISKYLILCEKSVSNNLTPKLILLWKYKTRKLYKKK